jgi:hypothetical protein
MTQSDTFETWRKGFRAMLSAICSTWPPLAESAARLLGRSRNEFLSPAECAAINGRGDSYDLITPPPANSKAALCSP